MRPEKGTYPEYYNNYIPLVNQENIHLALDLGWQEIQAFMAAIPGDMENYAYAEGKWTIKQVIQHLIDTERIFSYRALRFARKDPQQPLAFEENDYAAAADVKNRSLADLMKEFESVRTATMTLFKNFPEETLLRSGQTTLGNATVLSIGFATCGHALHHMNVIKDRYLKK